MAKMTSFWLPEKCYISAPRRNWLTGPSSGRSPCSCEALYRVSAHANLMRSLCYDANQKHLGTRALFRKTVGPGSGVISPKLAATRHNFKYVIRLISSLQISWVTLFLLKTTFLRRNDNFKIVELGTL